LIIPIPINPALAISEKIASSVALINGIGS
jgi:hypothetical protein